MMLFQCATHASSADHGHSETIKSENKYLTVDIHCHVHIPEIDQMTEGHWNVDDIPAIKYASDLTRGLYVEQNIKPRINARIIIVFFIIYLIEINLKKAHKLN